MKVSREKCAENRDRIVTAAAELFREKGFDGVAVADIMREAGLTHGGFYGHFESKDELAAEASRAALARAAATWGRIIDQDEGGPLPALVRHYLSERHRDEPGHACIFTTLAPDAARRGGAVQAAFTEGLKPLIDLLSRIVPGADDAARRRQALAAMSEMVGALILARIVDDPAFSDEILAAAIQDLSAGG